MFSFQSIPAYHQQLKNKITTCTDVVEHYLNEINKNVHLNAFVEVYQTEALQKAKELDERQKNWMKNEKQGSPSNCFMV